MKKNSNQQAIPAILWLDSLPDFVEHARELKIVRAYVSVHDTPIQGQMQVSGQGTFSILLSARSEGAILYYAETVKGVSHVDAFVQRDKTNTHIQTRVDEMTCELESAKLTVKKGRWTL